jgi:tetratricopeptide (TPR) repeat protein
MADRATMPVADMAAALGAALSACAPVILHVEDLHECDADRRSLVIHIGRAVHRTKGVGIVVTSRETTPEPFTPHRLEPLDPDASQRLLVSEAGFELPDEAVAWISRRAAGNPLYTLEYFRYLSRLGHLWNDGTSWRWRPPRDGVIPTSVEALVGQRLLQAQADPVDGKVLAALAYVGSDAPDSLVAAVTDQPAHDLRERVGRLGQAGVLHGREFAHPLFRELSAKAATHTAVRDMARRAIAALGADGSAAARFVADAHLPDAQALALLEAAAATTTDTVRAARLLAEATSYATGPTLTRLALQSAVVLQNNDLPEAIRIIALANAQGEPSSELSRLRVHLLARDGRQEEADELAQALGEGLVPGGHVALRLTSRNVAGDHAAAWRIWVEHPELHSAPNAELLRAATASALAVGQMHEAAKLIELGLATLEAPQLRAELLSLQALMAFHSGDAARADEVIRSVLDILEPLQAPRLRATALLNRAAFLKELGEFTAMGECLEECLTIRREAGDGKAYAFAQAALAELRLEQGRYDEAGDQLMEAIATLELYGPSRFLINARSMASALGLARGTPLGNLGALHNAEQALAAARESGNPRVVRELLFDASLANTATANAGRGLELALESTALAQAAGDSPVDNYRALWAQALAVYALGTHDEAVALMRAAYEKASQVEGAIDAHKIGLALAGLRGDREAVRTHAAWFAERGLLNGVAIAGRLTEHEAQEQSAPASRTRLDVLGQMQVTAGRTVGVKGEKRRRLLALLLEARVAGRGGVAKLALLDELYPDQDELSAAASLKVLVHGVRQSLGTDLVVTTAEGYALGDCATDVEEYLEAPDPGLWRGQYLDGAELDVQVRDSLYLALSRQAVDLTGHDPAEAMRLGRILVESEPYDLEFLAVCLRAMRAAGQHRSLDRQYQAARGRLAELGEELPPRWQEFLTGVPDR